MKRSFLLVPVLFILSLFPYLAKGQNIYTFAGIAGTAGYAGDGGLATIANLAGPAGIAIDGTGNVYFADTRNNVVRMVSTTGIISTFAGNGTPGYSGDGAAATAAQLMRPDGVAIDAAGNVYIADTRNNVVRMVNTSGVISTVAGNNTGGYSGDGAAATAAQLNRPAAVAVDGTGNLYISDSRNNVIREVTTTTGIINTIAGNNTAGYSGDAAAATAAQLNNPLGIAVDPAGNLYIADSRNHAIRMVSAGTISTIAGNGTAGTTGDGGLATAALLHFPFDVKKDAAGNIYISDSSDRVRMINSGDTINTFAGNGFAGYSGDGGAATLAEMALPDGIAIDASNNLYISCSGNNVIRRVGNPVTGITISSNTGDTVCINTLISFTANVIADDSAHYQWQVNGVNAGTDSAVFTPVGLVAGDTVSCILLDSTGTVHIAVSGGLRIDSLPVTGVINGPSTFCIGSATMLMDIGGPGGFGGGGGLWLSTNPLIATISAPSLVTPVAAGMDTIYYVLTNVCGSDSANLVITVTANPFGAISGPDSVCAGTTATYLTGSTAGTWHLQMPAGTNIIDSLTGMLTAGFAAGTVTVTYGSSPGCFASDRVVILARPAAGPITGPTGIFNSTPITLTDATAGGTWSTSDVTIATVDASGNVTGIANGIVTISYTITNALGCSRIRTHVDTVLMEALVTTLKNGAFSIYPNPATGTLNISWANQSKENALVAIADVSGRTVFTSEMVMSSGNNNRLDISSLKTGVYMITIQSGTGYYCSKLVVGE